MNIVEVLIFSLLISIFCAANVSKLDSDINQIVSIRNKHASESIALKIRNIVEKTEVDVNGDASLYEKKQKKDEFLSRFGINSIESSEENKDFECYALSLSGFAIKSTGRMAAKFDKLYTENHEGLNDFGVKDETGRFFPVICMFNGGEYIGDERAFPSGIASIRYAAYVFFVGRYGRADYSMEKGIVSFR